MRCLSGAAGRIIFWGSRKCCGSPIKRRPPVRRRKNMSKVHRYIVTNRWTGNLGSGTSTYTAYSRNHELDTAAKIAPIPCSSDPVFRGDPSRYNPEELLVGALSACHMLVLLHLCADAGIVVTDYADDAEA